MLKTVRSVVKVSEFSNAIMVMLRSHWLLVKYAEYLTSKNNKLHSFIDD
jgi:hypothetical protein